MIWIFGAGFGWAVIEGTLRGPRGPKNTTASTKLQQQDEEFIKISVSLLVLKTCKFIKWDLLVFTLK